ncbi:MAG: hypothetical protein RID09_04050 [Coleofasciculus sp. G1-WW12-02]|uniref:hypothetical protein n=1 Tax=unclassified Coleofasciculus TaxID=2692782 RepID=UPI0032FAC5CE
MIAPVARTLANIWSGGSSQINFVLFRRGGASRVVNKAKSLLSNSRIVLEAYTESKITV